MRRGLPIQLCIPKQVRGLTLRSSGNLWSQLGSDGDLLDGFRLRIPIGPWRRVASKRPPSRCWFMPHLSGLGTLPEGEKYRSGEKRKAIENAPIKRQGMERPDQALYGAWSLKGHMAIFWAWGPLGGPFKGPFEGLTKAFQRHSKAFERPT